MRVEFVERTHGARAVAILEAVTVGAAGGVFPDETWSVALGNSLECGDGGGEDADIRFKDRPVHGGADCPSCVGVDKHFGNEGYANDGRDTGTVNGDRLAMRSGVLLMEPT